MAPSRASTRKEELQGCGCAIVFLAFWFVVPVYFLGLMGVPIWAAVLLAYVLFWR